MNTVLGMRCLNMSTTDWLATYERPQSPVTTSFSQYPYCTAIGLSRYG